MNLDYVPLLPIQRELQSIPRGQPPSFNGLKRFRHYLRTISDGQVMKMAGCDIPTLDPDDLEYTREVVAPFLDADDMRTAIECLFGDGAARALGFTPRGLSPWAGLALALHDALRFEI
jgi:hypothetical protein